MRPIDRSLWRRSWRRSWRGLSRRLRRDPHRDTGHDLRRDPRRHRAGLGWVLALAAVLAGGSTVAHARSEKTLAYPRDQAWPTAVRFLVVDEHVKVTEKDAEAGYVLFELRDDGKVFRGALELATVSRDGRSQVRFVLQIADRPSWLEIAMLRRLEAKLRAELGSPSPPPDAAPRKDAPAPDTPKDGGKDSGSKDAGKDAGKAAPPRDDGPPISPTP